MPLSERLFQGEVPKTDPEKLSNGQAALAVNTKLQRGTLEAWRAPATIMQPTKNGTKKTIYRWGQDSTSEANFWFTWITDVDVVRAPISGDFSERTYYTGDGYPKKTDQTMALTGSTDYPVAAYKLGLPQPDMTGVVINVSGAPLDSTESTLLGAYVMTYVSVWGEESAMADIATPTFEFKNGQAMTLTNLPVPPAGNWNIPLKRLYRSNSGTNGAQYQLAAEIPAAFTSYTDGKLTEDLAEVCPTQGWYAPPDTGFGLTLGANGNAIMLNGRTIHACVPFELYAWPEAYQNTVDADIVGAGAFYQSFAILTKSYPYVLSGVDPDGYTLQKLPDEKACLSKRSIVSMMGGVIYASTDGLYLIDSTGLHAMTDKLFTKDQWLALNPATMHCYEYDGRYYAFHDGGCLMFDWLHDPFVVELNVTCTAAYLDPLRNSLYLAQGTDITKWDAGALLNYTWKSQEYRHPRVTSPSFAQVDALAYPVTFKMFGEVDAADGTASTQLIHTQSVTSRHPFRLPPTMAAMHQIQLEGSNTVRGFAVGGSGAEMGTL